MPISKSTERIWKRLNRDLTGKPSYRANKTGSSRRFIPKERCANPDTVTFITELLSAEHRISLPDIIYTLSCLLLDRYCCDRKLSEKFKTEYGRTHTFEQHFAKLELPEEFDLLGTIYQSFLTEGVKNSTGSYYTEQSVAQELLNSLGTKPGAAFLDPCCGSGTFLMLAQDMGLKVSGMDSDPIAVMIAKANLILAGATEYPDVRVTDFVSRWKSERRRFDFAATNPPWSSKTKNVYADVSSFFFMKTLSLLKSGGRLAFLMPISMLNIASHRLFREQLFSDCKLLEIRKFDTKFSGVQTDFVSILAEKAKPAETFRMIGTGEVREIPLSLFQLTEQKTIFSVTEPEVEIIYKILSKGELSLAGSKWALGIVTGNNKKHLKELPGQGLEPIYTGKEIRPFYIDKPRYFVHFNRAAFQQTAPDEIYRTAPKIIYRFISNHLVFAAERSGALVLNSANILIPNIPELSFEALLALLNSKVYSFIYQVLFGQIKVLRSNLMQLKLPRISAEQDEELKGLVLAAEANPTEEIQEKINQVIFSIYDLTDDEIEVVLKR
ncbi:TaqI-like C-terminal specificity domain-containing protein [Parasutterella sp.]|uniref:TaqI-like C-terminal specificity domain-containing protein n=2 Tax=Parasutterella sp. TaxID=2049037 RepID=UPI003AB6EB84